MIDVYGKDKLLPAITFEQACEVIRKKGRGDLLGGMEKMKAAYYDAETLGHYSHVVCPDNWMEFNAEETQAYNMVFEGFAELFNERKSDLNHLEKLAADFHSDGYAQTARDIRLAIGDIQNMRDKTWLAARELSEFALKLSL